MKPKSGETGTMADLGLLDVRNRERSLPSSVRSRGRIDLAFKRTEAGTLIAANYQAGCLKMRISRFPAQIPPVAVLLNTSGGLAEGDRLSQAVTWGPDTNASIATQAAEKVYRAMDEGASIETRLGVANRADAEWMPQETILFDRARLTRDMQVRVASASSFLGVEAVVFGRTAMGEVMRSGSLCDRWRIWRDGRLVYADALRLDGAVDELMARAAIGAGARAMAVLIHVSSRAASLLGTVREALAGALGTTAASAWNGMLVVRLLARDGAILRHDMLRALVALRGGRPLPRVWSC
jgi:urease accessory protein